MSQEQWDWPRWFGLSWIDFFTGTSVVVDPERELSSKQRLAGMPSEQCLAGLSEEDIRELLGRYRIARPADPK